MLFEPMELQGLIKDLETHGKVQMPTRRGLIRKRLSGIFKAEYLLFPRNVKYVNSSIAFALPIIAPLPLVSIIGFLSLLVVPNGYLRALGIEIKRGFCFLTLCRALMLFGRRR